MNYNERERERAGIVIFLNAAYFSAGVWESYDSVKRNAEICLSLFVWHLIVFSLLFTSFEFKDFTSFFSFNTLSSIKILGL